LVAVWAWFTNNEDRETDYALLLSQCSRKKGEGRCRGGGGIEAR
jgi:hypothetical protein